MRLVKFLSLPFLLVACCIMIVLMVIAYFIFAAISACRVVNEWYK